MNSKKFVVYFVTVAALTGLTVCFWIKQGYDSRPEVKIVEPVK